MESGIRRDLDLIIIAIHRADGSMHFNPSADTRLEADHTVIAVGQKQNIRKLEALLNA